MAVTATEVCVRFKHPPRDIFGLAPLPHNNELRFRVWPETAVTLTLAGKKPGAGWEPQTEDLTFAQQPGSDQRPYDRLIGAALDGERWLFARQDTVEAAWKIVDPVLGDAVPGPPLRPGQLGAQGGRPAAARPGHLARPAAHGGLTSPQTIQNERSGRAMAATSGSRRVVIVGGGFAGLFAARRAEGAAAGDADRPG